MVSKTQEAHNHKKGLSIIAGPVDLAPTHNIPAKHATGKERDMCSQQQQTIGKVDVLEMQKGLKSKSTTDGQGTLRK